MTNLIPYLFANAYSSFSPAMLASATCRVNGQIVDCGSTSAQFGSGFLAIFFILMVIIIISGWKLFSKAGKPGWASIIPIYNTVVLLEIVGKPAWWVILMFIPFVNGIVSLYIAHLLSKAFGKSAGFTIGLIVLPFIFLPILAFGNSQYIGNSINKQPQIA